jgi:hypothetical protein
VRPCIEEEERGGGGGGRRGRGRRRKKRKGERKAEEKGEEGEGKGKEEEERKSSNVRLSLSFGCPPSAPLPKASLLEISKHFPVHKYIGIKQAERVSTSCFHRSAFIMSCHVLFPQNR